MVGADLVPVIVQVGLVLVHGESPVVLPLAEEEAFGFARSGEAFDGAVARVGLAGDGARVVAYL